MGAFNRLELPGAFLGPRFKLLFIFNKIGSFVSGLFFPQVRVFNNFSALFSGLFLAIHVVFPCVFNNFSALFFKKRIFLSHSSHFSQIIAAGRRWKKDYHARPEKSSEIAVKSGQVVGQVSEGCVDQETGKEAYGFGRLRRRSCLNSRLAGLPETDPLSIPESLTSKAL